MDDIGLRDCSSSRSWTWSPGEGQCDMMTMANDSQQRQFLAPSPIDFQGPTDSHTHDCRPVLMYQHQPPLPLPMPHWPSMLNNQAYTAYQRFYVQSLQSLRSVQPVQPLALETLHTPISAASSRPAPQLRKTLSNLDRRRMCLYADEHPGIKQRELGGELGSSPRDVT